MIEFIIVAVCVTGLGAICFLTISIMTDVQRSCGDDHASR
jgi:hypothetical protein